MRNYLYTQQEEAEMEKFAKEWIESIVTSMDRLPGANSNLYILGLRKSQQRLFVRNIHCPPDHAYCLLSLPKPGAATTPEMKAEEHNSPHVDPEEKKKSDEELLFNQILLAAKGLLTPALVSGHVILIPSDNKASDDDPLYTTPLKTVLRGLRNMLTDFLGEKFLSFEEYFKQKNPDHQGSVRNLLEQLKTFLEEELRTLAQISAIAVAGMSNSK
uniref:Uncharacterized protein n=1 Tax=Ditylenchus dipsaci TaxID=166011 RepID=A0A915CZU2_9BILA